MASPVHVDTLSGYDRWALIYDDELNPLVLLEEPVVHGWLPSPRGLHIVDLGCGTGRHAAWLAAAGAAVDAFDASPGMMSKAAAKLASLGVRPRHHLLPEPLPVADATYDAALLALVADHLAELPATFREVFRVLKPGGLGIFTVLHPAMNLLGITARFTDPDTGDEIRVEAHTHTYADYLMAMLRSGLHIEEIVERQADKALAARAPRAEKYIGWPLLLAARLVKPR